jgi:hypothetical protein
MSIVIINHKVNDFKKWKSVYEKDTARRTAAGLKELHVATKDGSPNEVYMIYETKDAAKAQKMMQDPDLQKTMKEAGVISTPIVSILNKA